MAPVKLSYLVLDLCVLGFEVSVCSRMAWVCFWSVCSHCPWAQSCGAIALIFMLDKLS